MLRTLSLFLALASTTALAGSARGAPPAWAALDVDDLRVAAPGAAPPRSSRALGFTVRFRHGARTTGWAGQRLQVALQLDVLALWRRARRGAKSGAPRAEHVRRRACDRLAAEGPTPSPVASAAQAARWAALECARGWTW